MANVNLQGSGMNVLRLERWLATIPEKLLLAMQNRNVTYCTSFRKDNRTRDGVSFGGETARPALSM